MTGQQAQMDSKNLSYLEDIMKFEALVCKKCENYSAGFTDPGCKELGQTLAQHHKQRFDALLSYLKSH